MGTQGGFTVFKGSLYFQADDSTKGKELWVSDGTKTGTKQVKDINPGTATDSSSPVSTWLRAVAHTVRAHSLLAPDAHSCCVRSR